MTTSSVPIVPIKAPALVFDSRRIPGSVAVRRLEASRSDIAVVIFKISHGEHKGKRLSLWMGLADSKIDQSLRDRINALPVAATYEQAKQSVIGVFASTVPHQDQP